VVVGSRHEQRRPEKLGRRQSTTVYDGRSVMMMTLGEDELGARGRDRLEVNMRPWE